jgi:hypothetical protein
MAKAKMICLVMKNQEGEEIVNAEIKESQVKKIVKAYQEAGVFFRAEYKAVA